MRVGGVGGSALPEQRSHLRSLSLHRIVPFFFLYSSLFYISASKGIQTIRFTRRRVLRTDFTSNESQ